ncbi:MAG: hypothetical protein MUF27_13150 [Acidobacteria bacterium]|nr:hypothetical protein [Acidobacteriota bacterium]
MREVVDRLDREEHEAEHHDRVQHADEGPPADHLRLEQDLAQRCREPLAGVVGARAVWRPGGDPTELHGEGADEERCAPRHEECQDSLLPPEAHRNTPPGARSPAGAAAR